MRSVAFLVLSSFALVAQTPTAPTADSPRPVMTAKSAKALDGYLQEWEKHMAKIKGVESKLTLTESDGTATATFVGEAAFLKPNYAKLMLKPWNDEENRKLWREYIADGVNLWDLAYHKKVMRRLPLPKDGFSNFTLLALLTGVQADTLKTRYELYTDIDDKQQFTGHFLSITIRPKSKEDQQEFTKAEVLLWVSNDPKYAEQRLLPRRLWYQYPNKNQVTWEFTKIKANDLGAAYFKAQRPTKDWQIEEPLK